MKMMNSTDLQSDYVEMALLLVPLLFDPFSGPGEVTQYSMVPSPSFPPVGQ